MAQANLKPLEGKYEILEKMAEGGMGAVYKVHHRLLEEVRVIKVIRPQLDADEESRQRFLREARSAVRLRHPNIALLHDFTIADDGTSYMVMEYIDGVNLVDLVRQSGQPAISLVLEVGMQTLRALGYLHKSHFVHRDISPDNLMLARDVEGNRLVKLIDLGIAKPLESEHSLTSAGLFLGKVRYASPEHFGGPQGDATVEPRSDLYSLGIVLYVLLTGKYPIQGKDHAALMAGHLFHPPVSFESSDPLGRVPAELRAIVMRALAKRPDDRFASADAFATALAQVRARLPEESSEPDLIAPTVMAPMRLPTHGTTQDELDDHFRAEPTPAPFTLEPPRAPTNPPPPPAPPTEVGPAPPPPAAPAVAAATGTGGAKPAGERPRARLGLGLLAVLVAGGLVAGVLVVGAGARFVLTRDVAPTKPEPASARPAAATAAEPADSRPPAERSVEPSITGDVLQDEPATQQTARDPMPGTVAPQPVATPIERVAEPSAEPARTETTSAPRSAPAKRSATAAPTATASPPIVASPGRHRDLDTIAEAIAADPADTASVERARELMEASRRTLFAARSRAQTASAARLATTAFDSAKLLQRDGESHELAGRWVAAARAFRDSAEIFVRAAEEAEQRRAGDTTGVAASSEERAVLEAIEAYAQTLRRRSLSGRQLGSVESHLGGALEVRIDRCRVNVQGPRATAHCRMRQGYPGASGPPTGQGREQQTVFQLTRAGARWVVEQATPAG